MKIAVLVPFRDEPAQNRRAHLDKFMTDMPAVLDAALGVGNWRIYIGMQPHDGHKFARGRLLNAIFRTAVHEYPECDRVILHDVDLIPDIERAKGYAHPMAPSKQILALNTTGEYSGMIHYIGGICAMEPSTFYEVDGFPNEMEGWGGEDDAFRDRLPAFAIDQYTSGNVQNLEMDPCHVGMYKRAKNHDEFKSVKEHRREIRTLWKNGDPSVTGYSELLSSKRRLPLIPIPHHSIVLYEHDIFGWSRITSRTTGKTYYVHPQTQVTQWTLPS